jgi:hypothetical protein
MCVYICHGHIQLSISGGKLGIQMEICDWQGIIELTYLLMELSAS